MPTILCIDDDANCLELEKSILETNGYTVLIASDGSTGITLASKRPIDVVVLAFKMPGMDGGQVAEVLLKHQPDLPIVICTGYFDMVPAGLRWFAAACVEKRDGPDVLLSAIQEVIAHKKVLGQAVAA
jgi:CheY-like chemotaxis protein